MKREGIGDSQRQEQSVKTSSAVLDRKTIQGTLAGWGQRLQPAAMNKAKRREEREMPLWSQRNDVGMVTGEADGSVLTWALLAFSLVGIFFAPELKEETSLA